MPESDDVLDGEDGVANGIAINDDAVADAVGDGASPPCALDADAVALDVALAFRMYGIVELDNVIFEDRGDTDGMGHEAPHEEDAPSLVTQKQLPKAVQ